MIDLHNHAAIRKRFTKDFSLPIDVLSDPHFDYFIELYDEHFQTKEKLHWLMKVCKTCDTPDDFFEVSINLANKMKEKVKQTNAYKKLLEVNLDKEFPLKDPVPLRNIYTDENIDKNLFSIDLRQANFNSLRLLDIHKELEAETYIELMSKETEFEYYLNSKMIRQVIFGDLSPNRQQRIQKYIINQLCEKLKQNSMELTSASSDEIIVKSNTSIEEIKNCLKDVDERFRFFRIEKFNFSKIHPDHTYYVKNIWDEEGNHKINFKNTPSFLFPQVYKHYKGLPIQEEDLCFYHEKMLAQFKEPLFKQDLKKKIKP